jgi:putative copper resistance protein D
METSAWDVPTIIVKAILYAATLTASGAVFFLAYSGSLLAQLPRRRIHRVIGILIVLSSVVTVMRVPMTAGNMAGEFSGIFDPTLMTMVWRGGEDRAICLRLGGLALAAAALRSRRRWLVFAIPGACLAATSFAAIGHTHTKVPNGGPILLVATHLLSAAFWLGALMSLRVVASDTTPVEIGLLARRFSSMALAAVAVLIVAGTVLAWLLIGRVSALWTSPYGQGLAIKIGLVCCLLSVAAFNKWYLTPRLLLNDSRALLSLRRSIHCEMALAAAILLATATITSVFGPV